MDGPLFFRYNCTIPLEEDTLIIFPGEITHLYKITPLSIKPITIFSSKLRGRGVFCYEKNGIEHCPGFQRIIEKH